MMDFETAARGNAMMLRILGVCAYVAAGVLILGWALNFVQMSWVDALPLTFSGLVAGAGLHGAASALDCLILIASGSDRIRQDVADLQRAAAEWRKRG